MIEHRTEGREAKACARTSRWTERGVLWAVCALVIGIYACGARSGALELMSLNAGDTYYNLLVQGFRAGQLNLKKEAPPELAHLADPYDPIGNAAYRSVSNPLVDVSYYKGRLYLYFGVTPALILFWPVAALTGHYLFHREAVAIFCALGFLASAGLLRALWHRYFAGVSLGVMAACVLALGLATGVPVLLSRCDVYEVPIACGYMLTMLAVGAIWCALHQTEPRKHSGWMAAASVAYGLAVGARPSLLFGAVILLVPVAQAWRGRRPMWTMLTAAMVPILLIGLGLMLYNFLRFANPLEFGLRYELGPARMDTLRLFSLPYLWFNFRVYFLEPARWSVQYPFVHETVVPPLPAGRGEVETAFGVLSNIPLVWLAPLGAGLAWRGRSASERCLLCWFLGAVALVFGMNALVLCLFRGANFRYEVEFLPVLVLLAVVGILGVERALAPNVHSELAGRPVWRRAVRWGWGLLLAFSVAFNLLACVENIAEGDCQMGNALLRTGKLPEAITCYERALWIMPNNVVAHSDLGLALVRMGRLNEAIGHYEEALRIKPDFAEGHNNLADALERKGKVEEAIGEYEQALRVTPDYAEAHNNLGVALGRMGRLEESIGHFEQALRIMPDFAGAHNNLGVALTQAGKLPEAIAHFEQALLMQPDYAEAHYDLGVALEQVGRVQEAIGHYQQALRISPDFAGAKQSLARLPVVQ